MEFDKLEFDEEVISVIWIDKHSKCNSYFVTYNDTFKKLFCAYVQSQIII